MNVSITNSLEDFVRQQVNSGLYASVSEVVRHALRLLQERESQNIRDKINISLQQIENGQFLEADDKFWEDLENEIVKEIEEGN
jgi:antitoxin ParD1/3/4